MPDDCSSSLQDRADDSVEALIESRQKLSEYRRQIDAALSQLRTTEEKLMEALRREGDLRASIEKLQKRSFLHRAMNGVKGWRVRAKALMRLSPKKANGLFDAKYYLATYPDVSAAGMYPYGHYLKHGAAEGRFPNPMFHTAWYLEQNPDVKASGQNALEHYVRHGAAEGRDPHPLLHVAWYLRQQPHLANGEVNPLEHYLSHIRVRATSTSQSRPRHAR